MLSGLISIIIPVYNASEWIEETITSILNQNHTNWELIAIDDFSFDDSLSILKTWASKDHRIRVVRNKTKGIIPALQLGLELSQGEYITRFDADDIMPKKRLEIFSQLIQNKEKVLVTGRVEYFSKNEVSRGYKAYESWINERVLHQDHFKQIYRECTVASPNWMMRREDIIKHNIFDELVYPEDYDMIFRLLENNFTIESSPDITLFWREHAQRTSRNSMVYEQKSFFKLKINWWNKLESQSYTSVGVLGAGDKAKLILEHINHSTIKLYDLNFKKKNQKVHGLDVLDYNEIDTDCLLIAIYPNRRKDLELFVSEKGYELGRNAWYV